MCGFQPNITRQSVHPPGANPEINLERCGCGVQTAFISYLLTRQEASLPSDQRAMAELTTDVTHSTKGLFEQTSALFSIFVFKPNKQTVQSTEEK